MDKLTEAERDFLWRVETCRKLGLADREADRLRQRLRQAGLVEVLKNPRRWSLTDAGRSALASQKKGDGRG